MTLSYTSTGTFDAAGTFHAADPRGLSQWGQSVAGLTLAVTYAEPTRKRTSKQNRTLWGPTYDQMLSALMAKDYRDDERMGSHQTNDLKRLVHYGLLMAHYSVETDKVTGNAVPKKTSSQLTVKEFQDHLYWIQDYAAMEKGIVIQMPDEWRREK